nr:DNA polymerase-like [Tanacetum cinerariifolium]
MSLCPDLGTKGSVDHESVNEKCLKKDKEVLIKYMKTNILLLGGVMQKAQNIYWKLYQLDIESKITLSSLALNIFRLRYYNDEIFPINIPNQNEDTFIRKAYYGEYPMPCGKPVWYSNLEDMYIDSMLGFIEAYVATSLRGRKVLLRTLLARSFQADSGLTLKAQSQRCAISKAAIIASARIYMYPYISRDDCYYTDTDSVVLSQPFPEELISSLILGMLKLEDQIVKGFFLAPKAYSYYTLEGSTVKKYKGPAKDKVTPEWFEK